MTHPFETELSKLKEIDFDLEENISDDQLEKVYGGKFTTFSVGEQGGGRRRRRRRLWKFFFRRR